MYDSEKLKRTGLEHFRLRFLDGHLEEDTRQKTTKRQKEIFRLESCLGHKNLMQLYLFFSNTEIFCLIKG